MLVYPFLKTISFNVTLMAKKLNNILDLDAPSKVWPFPLIVKSFRINIPFVSLNSSS